MCHEVRDCIDAIRRETRTRVLVITGAGDRFFCIGGRKEGMEDTRLYAGVLPTLDMYEAIERLQKRSSPPLTAMLLMVVMCCRSCATSRSPRRARSSARSAR